MDNNVSGQIRHCRYCRLMHRRHSAIDIDLDGYLRKRSHHYRMAIIRRTGAGDLGIIEFKEEASLPAFGVWTDVMYYTCIRGNSQDMD